MPDILFDGWGNIITIAVSAPLAYLAIIAFIRLAGKRSTSQMNNFDWIVTVAMGSLVGSLLVIEDVTVAEALFAIGLLMGLQFLFTLGAARFEWVERIIKSRPTLLFDGDFRRAAMHQERITQSEIHAAIRENGLNQLSDVRFVVLESDASFSVVPRQSDHHQDELIGMLDAHSTRKR